jgi:hypothetical protein
LPIDRSARHLPVTWNGQHPHVLSLAQLAPIFSSARAHCRATALGDPLSPYPPGPFALGGSAVACATAYRPMGRQPATSPSANRIRERFGRWPATHRPPLRASCASATFHGHGEAMSNLCRNGPEHLPQAWARGCNLLDHRVSLREHYRWHVKANCLGGLEIDNQLKFARLLDRQLGEVRLTILK